MTLISKNASLAERRAAGIDQHDEVWNGEYFVFPPVDNEHQDFVGDWTTVFKIAVQWPKLGFAYPGINVSDRTDDWTKNYRCPVVAVFLNDTTAENHGAYWYGGPDFAIEIISDGDRTREKFEFYAQVDTRELLIVDRDPWALELYRLTEGELVLVGKSTPDDSSVLKSEVVPLSFFMQRADERPAIEVLHNDGEQDWTI